ncbi:MAG TPA: hypothetical protein ENN80_05890, partial [Candidatus Hydrogenedentes bacterium]|nr:hypothetical protein [Candidatus Hydrogenedentota bacterium]
MTRSFEELAALAARGDDALWASVSRNECLASARAFVREYRRQVRERHDGGASGTNVVRLLSDGADTLLRGVFHFALRNVANRAHVLSRVSLCALGGYGRAELSPHSDLDVCLLYEGTLDPSIEALNDYLVPFLWDTGYAVGYGIRTVEEAMALAKDDVQAFTSFLEARLIAGDNTPFARLKLFVRDWPTKSRTAAFLQLRVRERREALPEEYRDLYRPDPDMKENVGGLRDLHTAMWLLMFAYGTEDLDEVAAQGLITPEEHLEVVEALDFMWRIRNELHFHAGRQENRLTFEHQRHLAEALGYGASDLRSVSRLMEDYYAAACRLRRFLHAAVAVCDRSTAMNMLDGEEPSDRGRLPDYSIRDGELYVGQNDPNWFAENPVRFMEAFWECARYGVSLSRSTERLVAANLGLIGETFRSNSLARRFFVAICSQPLEAGHTLRHMANTGVLGSYIPEFAAVQGLIRYEDFHHYPVDEHTLRAIEALGEAPNLSESVGAC